ncbi:MAG TPA: hypothetical protein VMW17_12830 [Candidatus Binatia bacterium]|nr:hypothetical protein [Candidatus Binatia bacterium]
MKLLVLGSSNEIGPGSYVDHLGRLPDFEIINRSIGASSTSAGLYALLSDDTPDVRYALINYEVNDEGVLQTRIRTAEEVSLSVRTLLYLLRARGCTPVLTILPSTPARDRPSWAETLHRTLCREEGVHVVGGADLFRAAWRTGGRWDEMLRDPFHMGLAATPIVAAAFARAFRALDATSPTPREWTTTMLPIRVVPAAVLVPPERRVFRASSHRSAWHAVLRLGERLTVPVGPGERLLAMAINSGAPGATVAFTSDGQRVVKRLAVSFSEKTRGEFISVVVDFKQAVPGGTSGILIEVLPADAEETEPTLHQQPVANGRPGVIEIEGFVVAAGSPVAASCTGVARPRVPCELSDVIDSEKVVARLATLGDARLARRQV